MNPREPNKVALLDLDGTVADFNLSMSLKLEELKSPFEEAGNSLQQAVPAIAERVARTIKARKSLIKKQPGFWRNLPRIELGFQIVREMERKGFDIHVLTKGPSTTTSAWTEKVEWVQENLPDASITITQDKSLMYGAILVDDWPEYFEAWLEARPRGLVICVAQPWNEDVDHPQVVRYDGTNLDKVRQRIREVSERCQNRS